MKEIKVAVIGLGFIGRVHIEQIRRLGRVKIVAVCDKFNAKKAAEELFIPRYYDDYKKLIAEEELDCVHICTPNNTHYDIAVYAMEHNLNVICEKPLAISLKEAEALRDLAKEKGLVNAMNLNCRFYPLVYQMHDMVKNGEVGDILSVHGEYLQDWLLLDTDYSWRIEPALSGKSRAFADIGSHWIDTVQFVTGLEVEEVFADFEIFHKTRKKPLKAIETFTGKLVTEQEYEEVPVKTEDYASVLFHFTNGSHGSCIIHQMFAGRKNQITVSIAGKEGSLHWDSEKSNSLWEGKRQGMNGEISKDPSLLSDNARTVVSYPGGHVEGFPDTLKQNFNQIYKKIAGEEGLQDFATFADGARELRLIEKIVESAQERKWVKIK